MSAFVHLRKALEHVQEAQAELRQHLMNLGASGPRGKPGIICDIQEQLALLQVELELLPGCKTPEDVKPETAPVGGNLVCGQCKTEYIWPQEWLPPDLRDRYRGPRCPSCFSATWREVKTA